MKHFAPIIILTLISACFISCGNKTSESTQKADSTATDTVKKMSVEDAEANMFTKQSDYNPNYSQDLSKENAGAPFHEADAYLKKSSLVNVLADWIISTTGVPDKNYAISWNDVPVDTLFLDDFQLVDGKIGTSKDIMQVVDFDRMWCSVISTALEKEKRDQAIVQACKVNLAGQKRFYSLVEDELAPYSDNTNLPHKPLVYVYRFEQFLSIYIESLGRNANYFFPGFSFYDIQKNHVIYSIEEFNF